MNSIRATTHLLSIDRIAVIAALNIASELLAMQNEKLTAADKLNDRLRDLLNKMDHMLVQNAQLELSSAE